MDRGLNQTHLFSDQSMANLPPLPSSQDWLSSHVMGIGDNIINGGAVNFSQDHQHPYTYNNYTNPQQQPNYPFINPNNQTPPLGLITSSSSTALSMEFSQFLSFELEKQSIEIEAYLHLQNQSLNTVLREETRQRGVILETYASNLVGLIQKKEYELAIAKQTSMEIEQCILKTDAQVKTWKKLAMEKEAIVADLNYKLKTVEKRIQMMSSAEDEDSTTFEDKRICKMCQAQESCVVVFPCKHLCCCKSCEATVEFCPICKSLKEGSMEIFLA